MSKKILFCASTVSHILNFHLPYLKAFQDKGYEVWVAANEQKPIPYADFVVALPIQKKFTSFENIKAIFAARQLMKKQSFDIISTHTTLASAIVRIAVLLLLKKPKVFCTVHGYLFNENDGFKKWFYLLPEKICAPITNVLMVMNHEDYEIAKKHKLYKNKLYFINGMGIDLSKYPPISPEERLAARKKLNLADEDFAYVYAAEFSKRKNQSFLIRAFAETCKSKPHLKLFLAGEGALLEECKELAQTLGVAEQITFLGYVNDIRSLYAGCDTCVSTSLCEGLPFNIMEAMACGLPVIASDIKGHHDLLCDGKSGLLYSGTKKLQDHMNTIAKKRTLYALTQENGLLKVKRYDIHTAFSQIMNCYQEFESC
ncbi:glycosyltransferase family 4 protein [Caproicibacter sp.]|uniref:glycosyltransferase family 4 protein n=1 Tax=Caproicibacter sp. TaxID=2814884 RepID=UPI0039894D96